MFIYRMLNFNIYRKVCWLVFFGCGIMENGGKVKELWINWIGVFIVNWIK